MRARPLAVLLALGALVAAAAVAAPAGALSDRTAPSQPTGLNVTSVTATQVGLAWAKSTDNVGVAGYFVYRGTVRRTTTTNSYLDSGLTAATSYTYSVAAYDRAGNVSSRSASVTVKTAAAGLPPLPALPAPPAAPVTTGGVVLGGCASITAPGTYALNADVVGPADATCLDVHDTTNVTVDCHGHTITSAGSTTAAIVVNVANVSGFNLYNCTIDPAAASAQNYLNEDLALTNVTGGTVQHDQFLQRTLVVLSQVTNLAFTDDTVDGMVQSDHGSGNAFRWLRASMTGFQGSSIVTLGSGDHETVQYSTIDGGGGTATNGTYGMDDGLLLQWPTAPTVDSNVVAHAWDCDIETMGLVTGAQITNNQLNFGGNCGVGAWWWSSWRSNVVRNNRIDSSGTMLWLFRLGGLDTAHGETTVYFDNNTIDSNGVTNPTGAYGANVDLTAADNPALVGLPLVVGANVVSNNDWRAAQYAPILVPATMFTDGGGNRCNPSTDPRTRTVRCN